MQNEKKDYIEGIYNYCDRWCEKCTFTANCFLFTEESKIKTYEILHNGDITEYQDSFQEDVGSGENSNDIDNEDVENEDAEFFELFNDYTESPTDFSSDLNSDSEELKHPLADMLDDYLDKAEVLTDSLNEKYNFYNLPKGNIDDPFVKEIFKDFEVFSWYYTFLAVKIKRALFGLKDLICETDDELKEVHRYDINGSAKIGIIAIKKTIEALNNLYIKLPLFSEKAEELLICLGKILNLSESTFPDCMQFKRPGLDE